LGKQISSVINNTPNPLHMWSDLNETGTVITVDSRTSWDFSAGNGLLDDATQSADTLVLLSPGVLSMSLR
jgi:hypothetical protein